MKQHVELAVVAGIAMAAGWGLRGSIGGGPLGALIPGAVVGLVLAWHAGLGFGRTVRLAGLSAVAVSFGGDMTYGQTIGLLREAPTFGWGLLGLTLKGAVWGMLAAPLVWVAGRRELPRLRDAAGALAAIPLGAALGWHLVNGPKLIYFSNPVDRPRPEIWFGLLLAGLGVAGWLGWRLKSAGPWKAWAVGALGGGFGFGAGSLIMLEANRAGRVDGWKLMEYFFGFWLGVAMAWGARPEEGEESGTEGWPWFAGGAAVLAGAGIASEELSRFRYSWECTGALLLAALWLVKGWRHAAALALPFIPSVFDLIEIPERRPPLLPQPWLGILAAVLIAGFVAVAARTRSARGMLTVLLIGCMTVAWLKFAPSTWLGAHVPLTMTAMAAAVLWACRRERPGARA